METRRRKGRWEAMAERRIATMRAKHVVDELTDGYADQLRAAGLAIDLAEAGGTGGAVAYAMQAWQSAMANLVPPPGRNAGPEEHADAWFDDVDDDTSLDPGPDPPVADADVRDPETT